MMRLATVLAAALAPTLTSGLGAQTPVQFADLGRCAWTGNSLLSTADSVLFQGSRPRHEPRPGFTALQRLYSDNQ